MIVASVDPRKLSKGDIKMRYIGDIKMRCIRFFNVNAYLPVYNHDEQKLRKRERVRNWARNAAATVRQCETGQMISQYSEDLNTRHVRYSNGPNMSDR